MSMELVDEKEVCEIVTIDDHRDYRRFLASFHYDVALVPESYREICGLSMKPDAAAFAKWLKNKKSELRVDMRKADSQVKLYSNDVWLPLVYLASDFALPVFLNLVASYLYDRMKGALRGEKKRVHLEVMYEDKQAGIVKKFCFEGEVESLEKAVKKIDVNQLME